MLKSLFLYYYSLKGYKQGLFFAIGYMASMLALLFIGLACMSEVLLEDGLLSNLAKGSFSIGSNSRGFASILGKLLGLFLIIVLGAILFVPSYFLYKNWTVDFDKMDYSQRLKTSADGEKVMNVFGIFVLVVVIGGVLLLVTK